MFSILVVEDDKGILGNLSLLLGSEGYNVITALNGLEAIRHIENKVPDLILSDIMMPYLDGLELFRRVKEEYKLINTPFIFLTAKSDVASMRKGLGMGADDYISKPFENEDVLQAIKVRLQKTQQNIQQIESIKACLTTYVPHELRTPLVSILGFSEMIRDDIKSLDSCEVKEMANKINLSGKRLLNRIEKFINAYEVESLDKQEINQLANSTSFLDAAFIKSAFNITNQLVQVENEIDIVVQEANIKISDRYLKIIIKEILENAAKFSLNSTSIVVVGKKVSKKYTLLILNKGIGMSKSEIANISQFSQFNRERFNMEGNGLGLALTKKILDLFGGKLSITSRKNTNTCVKIILPAA